MMSKKHMLTTGEFAKLCKTTKQTLFHYDKENLLKPKYVSENGYRHYGMEQFFDFDLITMLKETGSSLKEIRTYFRNMNGADFLSLLEAKCIVVKKERERLAQREMRLRNMVVCTREALDFAYDKFMIQEQQEERLEAFPMNFSPLETMPEFVERFVGYVEFYQTQERVPLLPFGFILSQEEVSRERLFARYFFSRATRSTPRSLLRVKPKGKYAVIAHKGTAQSHLHTFNELLRQIKIADLVVAGDSYAYDMMNDIFQKPSESFALKYCISVK